MGRAGPSQLADTLPSGSTDLVDVSSRLRTSTAAMMHTRDTTYEGRGRQTGWGIDSAASSRKIYLVLARRSSASSSICNSLVGVVGVPIVASTSRYRRGVARDIVIDCRTPSLPLLD